MSKKRVPRKSPDQWLALIQQWQQSELTAQQFCKEQALGYATFCKWRQRLTGMPRSDDPGVSFVDLGAMAGTVSSAGWQIVLSLGNGVELRLTQA